MVFRVASGGGSAIALQTNSIANSSQSILNLAQGGGMSITEAGGTVTFVAGAVPSDIIASDAPNTDFDLTNGGAGGAVTILSKGITIAAKDQISIEMWFSILNNSTATRVYTATANCGSFSVSGGATVGVVASATSRTLTKMSVQFSISATNLAWGQMTAPSTAIVATNTGIAPNNNTMPAAWNNTVSDLTGVQTVSFQITSPSTTATQTLTLNSYTIRKISSNP